MEWCHALKRAVAILSVVGFSCLLPVLPAAGQVVSDPVSAAEWQVLRSDQEAKVRDGAVVVVENPHGDVRVRAGLPGRLAVHAVAQRHLNDPRRESIAISPGDATVALRVDYPADGAESIPAEWSKRRVDLALEVPPTARLVVRTDRGLIEVRGHAAELEVRSTAGDIRLRVAGPVDARTERGAILAALTTSGWHLPARFGTVTGGIHVLFPARADVTVRLETRGSFTTDVSLRVERLGPQRKRAVARLGKGRGEVVLTSDEGPLRLEQMVEPVPAELPEKK